MQRLDGVLIEDLALGPGDMQTVCDVAQRILVRQGFDNAAHGNAVIQLRHPLEAAEQIQCAHEQQRKRARRILLKIEEQLQTFEHTHVVDEVGFVDDDHRMLALFGGFAQFCFDAGQRAIDPLATVRGGFGRTEFGRDIGQKGGGGHFRKDEMGDRSAGLAHFVLQERGHRRLARADSAAQHARTQAMLDHVPQFEPRREMGLAVEEKRGRKMALKRPASEIPVLFVHWL